ncbi:hypothetical protein TWF694_010050 [Orbilia ellipsospora]|uniref:CHAT domain-containing protein n=1 Tax=Orbilia ellipsospora TaxID=2528407 RepID=A0AAV9X9Y3_9PEZI
MDLRKLDEAIGVLMRMAQMGIYDPDILDHLAILYVERFEQTGFTKNLNCAVKLAKMAVRTTSKSSLDRCGNLKRIATQLKTRFDKTDSRKDLDNYIEITKLAMSATASDHPNQATLLTNLGLRLRKRYFRTRSLDDLNEALEATNTALGITPQNHPDWPDRLLNLGDHLRMRFERTDSIEDLNRAIKVTEMAAKAASNNYDQATFLNTLGDHLGIRSERTGSTEDLHRAIEVVEMAINAVPQGHPHRAGYLSNLGRQLAAKFDRMGLMEDINRAIKITEEAVSSTPRNHIDRAPRLCDLGNRLGTRFGRTGLIEDLDRAVEVTELAVNTTNKPTMIDQSTYLGNLGVRLGMRSDRTGSMEDLNRAIEITKKAIDSTPQNHPKWTTYLMNIGPSLYRRFQRTNSIEDLNLAIKYTEMALNAMPQDYPNRAGLASNLGSWYGSRYKAISTDPSGDLDRAIEMLEIAANVTPKDNPKWPEYISFFGYWLGERFNRTDLIEDLNLAVKYTEMAVSAIPQDHRNRASCLNNLGICLWKRYIVFMGKEGGSKQDLYRGLSAYIEGWHCYNAPVSLRIHLARTAARIFTLERNWKASEALLEEAIELLPVVSPRSLKHTDKQSALSGCAGLASMAAAASLKARNSKDAYRALRLLELGRGIIASTLMEMRGDISSLRQQHPDLANEFISLREALDSPTITDDTRRKLDQEFNKVISRVRNQAGFSNFLLPPTENEMKQAACFGPIVVINVDSLRCDAFLIELNHITVLELPNLKLKDIEEKSASLRSSSPGSSSSDIKSTLEWLWDTVCGPVLERLGFKDSICEDKADWPRVWWIPTGLLSQFPLHAAGYHEQGSTETVLDRVMSSYAPSIKALIYGRQHRIQNSTGSISSPDPQRTPSRPKYALLVAAMKHTPDLLINSVLPFVKDEINMLKELCPSLQLKFIRPTLQKKDVLKYLNLKECQLFHFAGHGLSHSTEPSQSYLLLEDWKTNPLTVGDIRDCKYEQKFLSYLSACLTGTNEVEKLADEGIHFISAFQLAGFRHVIGTLWEVSDKYCVSIAREFYETIRDEGMTDMAVCRGLHQAIRALRDGSIDKETAVRNGTLVKLKGPMNYYWVPYVHFGV